MNTEGSSNNDMYILTPVPLGATPNDNLIFWLACIVTEARNQIDLLLHSISNVVQ